MVQNTMHKDLGWWVRHLNWKDISTIPKPAHAQIGEYMIEPANNRAKYPEDYTSFMEGDEGLARDNLPAMLGFIWPAGHSDADNFYLIKPGTVIDPVTGQPKMGINGRPLRNVNLPNRISYLVEGYHMAYWRLKDPRITFIDIIDRFGYAVDDPDGPICPAGSNKTSRQRTKIFQNTLSKRMSDFYAANKMCGPGNGRTMARSSKTSAKQLQIVQDHDGINLEFNCAWEVDLIARTMTQRMPKHNRSGIFESPVSYPLGPRFASYKELPGLLPSICQEVDVLKEMTNEERAERLEKKYVYETNQPRRRGTLRANADAISSTRERRSLRYSSESSSSSYQDRESDYDEQRDDSEAHTVDDETPNDTPEAFGSYVPGFYQSAAPFDFDYGLVPNVAESLDVDNEEIKEGPGGLGSGYQQLEGGPSNTRLAGEMMEDTTAEATHGGDWEHDSDADGEYELDEDYIGVASSGPGTMARLHPSSGARLSWDWSECI